MVSCWFFIKKNTFQFVENKVSESIRILYKAKNIASKDGLKTLYFSFVHTFLDYGNIAWGSTTRTKLKNSQGNDNRLLEQFMLQNMQMKKRKK